MTKRRERKKDSTYIKLQWNVEGIFDKLVVIQNELSKKIESLPKENTKDMKKIQTWQSQLINITQKMENITQKQIPELEKQLKYDFETQELVLLSFFQSSINNLFRELKIFFNKNNINSVSDNEFHEFVQMSEVAIALALIGDAAIDLALFHIHWNPSLSKVKDLNDKREKFANNDNIAKICDKWKLYDYRIHLETQQQLITKDKVNQRKATIVEALFGVIYIENGLEAVISSVTVLK